jgi:hypothetical protein
MIFRVTDQYNEDTVHNNYYIIKIVNPLFKICTFVKTRCIFSNKIVALDSILSALMTYENTTYKECYLMPKRNTKQEFTPDSLRESRNNGGCDLNFSTDRVLNGYKMTVEIF